jgi:predicted butyrate kinase (DUF1464 family)
MLSLGIDFDTTAWRAAVWDEDRAADLQTFGGVEELWEFVDGLCSVHPATPIVLPSGFGVPLTRVAEIMDQDIFEMTLERRWQSADTLGRFLAEARRRALRAYCIPAVKLLPSVPPHRKLNRVDLGTSDVLCAAAWAIHCLGSADHPRNTCDFVLLHTRPSTRSLLVVRAGQVVDGIGASTGHLELGQSESLCGLASRPAHDRTTNRATDASDRVAGYSQEARCEALQKEVFGLLGFHKLSRVILTGVRRAEISQTLKGQLPITSLPAPPDGFEPALGAAVVAAGLTGGPTAELVEHLGFREARERVLDWITTGALDARSAPAGVGQGSRLTRFSTSE